MIIHALNEYYMRLVDSEDAEIARFGFVQNRISFALVLSKDGKLIDVNDLRLHEKGKVFAMQLLVPFGGAKTSGIKSDFLWGNTVYVLGRGSDEKEKEKGLDWNGARFKAFKEFQCLIGGELQDEGMKAVLTFLDSWEPENLKQSKCWEYWDEMAGANVVFRLDGELGFIHEHPELQGKWKEYCTESGSGDKGCCLVTGKETKIARLHGPKIKGVKNSQSTGAALVSFNLPSFCSYNKEQSLNAPVGKEVAFNYCTALNHLLAFESRQKVQIGDVTVIFWGENKTPVEGFLKEILDPSKDNHTGIADIRRFFEAIREGRNPNEIQGQENLKFYILGLSANAARLSVRFWYVNTVESISKKIEQHFRDVSIESPYKDDAGYFGIWRFLAETAVQKKAANASPLLAGAFVSSIITGAEYPIGVYSAVLRRIRADQEINRLRTALLKGYLVRKHRVRTGDNKEVIGMALNSEEKNAGYLLGRLFAVLEKVQKDAIPGAKSTIKDRFYGSASATPSVVFPRLLKLSQHHIQKSAYGSLMDKKAEEIMRDMSCFPTHLSLDDQGMFAIGYYHQKNAFYNKTKEEEV